MNTIIKTFSAIGAISILATGIYINSDPNENTVEDNSQQSVIIENDLQPVQLPFVDEIETDIEPKNDLQGVKVIPKPEPVKTPVQEPVVEPEPVKEEPATEEKEQPQPVEEEVKKESVKPETTVEEEQEKPEQEEPKTDNVKAIDRAKDVTKGYCSSELWVKWNPSKEDVYGQARRNIVYWEDKSNPDIQTIVTMISPELDGDINNSTHIAWHECAHAKTYSIPVDKTEEIIKEVNETFPESEYSRIELLADAMATVKTGSTESNYYYNDFTKEQLALAEKIWILSPEVTAEMEYDYEAYQLIDTIR